MEKNNITKINNPKIDPDEYSAMETDAEKAKIEAANEGKSLGLFKLIFRMPFEYMNNTYKELSFDFDSLSGKDCLDIGNELLMRGISVVAPEFSSEYQRIYAAKSCIQKLPSDAYLLMPAKEFLRIVRAARTFLVVAE